MKVNKINSKTDVQYNCIDLLKFLMAVMVVTIHTNPFANINMYINYGLVNYLARLAVPFYFMCSGFFLFRKMTIDNINIDIIKNSILKLLRLYLIWTGIYSPLIIYIIIKSDKGILHSILKTFRNFIFSGSYLQLWYLPASMVAVFLVAVLLLKKVKLIHVFIVSACLYIIGLLGQSYFGILKLLFKDNKTMWNLLKITGKIIDTTRNGIFFGFIFVVLGALFAFKPIKLKIEYAVVGLVISLIFLFAEVIFVLRYNLAYERNMDLFLVPATFFLFYIVYNIKLRGDNKYKHLRTIGMLVFYNHMIVNYIIKAFRKIVEIISGYRFENSMVMFCFTIIFSIIAAEIIIKISSSNKFKWLKTIY